MFVPVFVSIAVGVSIGTLPTPKMTRDSAERALPLLQQAASTHAEVKTCFGCHNQGPTLGALQLAKSRGFKIPKEFLEKQREHILEFVNTNREQFINGTGTGGNIDTAGTLLLALENAEHKPDENTAAVAEYLLKFQAKQDHWTCTSDRPPTEASHFTTTWLAIRGLKTWATEKQLERADKRIKDARAWLEKTPPKDTEDAVFRLLALHEAGAEKKTLEVAAKHLRELQRPDGGWGQLPKMDSDAYATGTALVALHKSGTLQASDSAYQAGLRFLWSTQLGDGTWKVKSRSKPFQKYYEGGFPHEKDQFISSAASGWAAQALLLGCGKSKTDQPR